MDYDAAVWHGQRKWNSGSMFKSNSGLAENKYELIQKKALKEIFASHSKLRKIEIITINKTVMLMRPC